MAASVDRPADTGRNEPHSGHPGWGFCFVKPNRISETLQFVIYIVPHLEYPEERIARLGEAFESVYREHVRGF